MFASICGHERIKAYLERALLEKRLPQTLLFAGPDGVGKGLLARALAASLLGKENSPDFHILRPESKSGLYEIEDLREMMGTEHEAPFEAPGKVFLLEEVNRMQPVAANALLKTLEEPRPDTTFILLSSHPREILPTLLSRCTQLNFHPLKESEVAAVLQAKGLSGEWARLSQGSVGRALVLAEHPEIEEDRKLLFSLLAERPSYPELSLRLGRLEERVEEKKEEDPVGTQRRVEHLFELLLMWHRDQVAREVGAERLFFPEELAREPVSLKEVERALEKARLAYQRNFKLSHCLTSFFLKE